MKRSLLIVALALLCLRVAPRAQAQDAVLTDARPSTDGGTPSPNAAPAKPPAPVGVLSVGYIYIASEVMPAMPWQFHLHGFYGIPQVNIKPWFGIIGDFTKSYNTSAGAHENTDSFLCGPIFTALSSKKLSVFGFADAGKLRDSKDGMITSSPIFAVGGGVTLKLNKHVGLLFVPGEYIRAYPATGTDLNNFSSRFGLTFPLYR